MNDKLRIRALDEIDSDESIKNNWRTYNDLFTGAVPEFDYSFDRGLEVDLNYYVKRILPNGSYFEDIFIKNLFTPHLNPTGKMYILEGYVGSGKTTLCRYLQHEHTLFLRDNVLLVRLDVWPDQEDEESSNTIAQAEVNELFIEAVYEALLKKNIIGNKANFYKAIVDSIGFPDLSPDTLYRIGKDLSLNDVLEYLFINSEFTIILIIIDNIDETNKQTIEYCKRLASKIAKKMRKQKTKRCCVLLPLRDYTISRYFDQKHFPSIELPSLKEADVVSAKLKQAEDSIVSQSADYSQELGYIKTEYPQKYIHGYTLTISKENRVEFLHQLSLLVLSEKEEKFFELIRFLGGGNLKILVGNMYNFIHSCKLPLTGLFEKILVPPDQLRRSYDPTPISFTLALECLMCIHFPFYDIKSSHIINVFNLFNSRDAGDYKNTLSIPRLLLFLSNNGEQKYERLKQEIERYGYTSDYIEPAINKCFNYGLLTPQHGRNTKHLNPDSNIRISSVGETYIKYIIPTRYLQLVCEDTPMPPERVIDINEKYTPGLNINKSNESEKLFRMFIKEEEDIEKKDIEILGYSWEEYIFKMGYRKDDRGISISQYLSDYRRD